VNFALSVTLRPRSVAASASEWLVGPLAGARGYTSLNPL